MALGTGGTRLFRRELVRVAAGMRGAPTLAGDLALALAIHACEAAAATALLARGASLMLLVLAAALIVLGSHW